MLTRGVIVAFFAFGGVFSPPETNAPPRAVLIPMAAFILVSSAFSAQSMLRSVRKRQPDKNWQVPSWTTPPFSGPAHFIHTAAWSFGALGAAALLSDAVKKRTAV